MPRPRKDSEGPSARDRLESAFWDMLSEMPFDDITIRAISSRANVSHNTFYAYFGSLDDMAERLIDDAMDPETAPEIVAAVSGSLLPLSQETQQRFAHIRLYARSNSKLLEGLLRRRLQQAWLSVYNIDPSALSREQSIDLTFIFAGITTLLGDDAFDIELLDMARFLLRPLGQGAAVTLEALREA